MVIKRKLKFEDYKHCLEVTKLENRIKQFEKNEVDVDSLQENLKEFIKNSKLILKSQQIFKSKKDNVFTEEVNKIALNANDVKRIQPVDSIDTYAYGAKKDLESNKEEIKSNNIIKQYKND